MAKKKDNPSSGDDPLFFGKYKSQEEAEKGWRNMVGALDDVKGRATRYEQENQTLKAQLAALQAAVDARGTATPQPSHLDPSTIVSEEGHLDVVKLLSEIDNRISGQTKPLLDAMEKVPDMINQGILGFTQPLIEIEQSKKEFLGRDDIDPRFTDAKMQEVLNRNQSIKAAHERLLADPSTRGQAYEFVYDVWRAAEHAKPEERKTAVNQDAKHQANEPDQAGGPPVDDPMEQKLETMRKISHVAQDMQQPDAALEFARQWIKGSQLEKTVQTKPEWAEEMQQEGIEDG